MSCIVTICARGGSKGVKGKNTRDIAGLPLIIHTLRQAKQIGFFSAFAVSSDSPEILNLAESEGFITVTRPPEMATDVAAKVPAIRHCVNSVEKMLGLKFDLCFDLDCTSPLRDLEDIYAVHDMLQTAGTPNVITGMHARRSPYFNLVEKYENGQIRLSKKLETPIQRRQDSPQCYDMNGSIYGWRRNVLETEDSLFLEGTKLYIMPEERSIDIDSPLDFEIVKMLLEKKNKT